jgi:hypothetical protein
MTPATLDPPSEKLDWVRQWRLEQLERAGYPATQALQLAGRLDIDIHDAARLLQDGCSVETAVRILL